MHRCTSVAERRRVRRSTAHSGITVGRESLAATTRFHR